MCSECQGRASDQTLESENPSAARLRSGGVSRAQVRPEDSVSKTEGRGTHCMRVCARVRVCERVRAYAPECVHVSLSVCACASVCMCVSEHERVLVSVCVHVRVCDCEYTRMSTPE